VYWVVERVRERWPLEVRVDAPADAVEAPALRLDASAARERLGWTPRLDAAAAVAATVSWYDEVRAGSDARAVTLTQIEDAT
jgi:CDP-glucose 4,6-dehydratase